MSDQPATPAPKIDPPDRWWVRPMFGVFLYTVLFVSCAADPGHTEGRPRPTPDQIIWAAAVGIGTGLAWGFGGNWLAARHKCRSGEAAKPSAG